MNTTATRPIVKAGIVKFAGEFYRVSRLTSKTVNLASIFGGTVTVKVAPEGQMAAIVKELEVTVTVEDAATVRDALLVTVQFSYLHHGVGSNGVTRQFIAATERRFGKVSFTGMIELEVFRALHRSVIND